MSKVWDEVPSLRDSEFASSNPVLSDYRSQLHEHQEQLSVVRSRRFRGLIFTIACLSAMVALMAAWLSHAGISVGVLALPAIGAIYFFEEDTRQGRRWHRLSRQCDYLERGIGRLTGRWQGSGESGAEYARDHHLYQEDLNVLGKGSLFELLCTTRSKAGAERLAEYLLDPVELEEIQLRQEAVRELADAGSLREEIACMGAYDLQDCSVGSLHSWLSLPVLRVPRVISVLLLVCSATSLVLGIGILVKLILWSRCAALLGSLLTIQLSVAGILFRRTQARLQQLRLLTNSFEVLQQGLELMQARNFDSEKLRRLVERVRGQGAAAKVRRLERLIRAFDQREKPYFFFPALFLVVGTQLVLAVERWRGKHQEDLRVWIDAWAEFEALQAMAAYAYEQPGCVFPDLVEEMPCFEASGLAHPLIAADTCVCNDVSLHLQSRFYLITGSNMAGKSTFLRSIGLNAVMALAGGPIRATSARVSRLTVCASIGVTDSLMDGRSKFFAEVSRLEEMVSCARMGMPVLFLIDEVLSGTNSKDRKTVAEGVLQTLLKDGAIGALSTHDSALAEIGANPMLLGSLIHMESGNPDDPLDFDYRVKPGISTRSSALAIAKMIGICSSE